MCVSGFSSEKTRDGQLALSFYFTKILHKDIAIFTTFSPIFQHFRLYFPQIHNKMFRVRAKTKVGSGNLKHTYFVWPNSSAASFTLFRKSALICDLKHKSAAHVTTYPLTILHILLQNIQ